jgi:phosphorylase kinase alpha/beta subunit
VGYASAKLAIRASRVNKLLVPDFCVMPMDISHSKNPVEPKFAEGRLIPDEIKPLLECMMIETEITCYRTFEVFLEQYPVATSVGMGESLIEIRDLVKHIDYQSKIKGYWLLSRYCASVLKQSPNDLADGLMMLTARNLSVVIGKGKVNVIVIDAPMENSEIVRCVYKLYYHPLERTLVQEFLAIIGTVMRTEPRLFDGLRSIQVQNLMMLCADATENTVELDILLKLGAMAPSVIGSSVRDILDRQHRAFVQGLSKSLYSSKDNNGAESAKAVNTDWLEWRIARGSIAYLGDELLLGIWKSMGCAHSLAFGDGNSKEYVLNCEWVRRSMTAGEASFASLIDQHIQSLHPTYYKSAVIEGLYAFTQFCEAHPKAKFSTPVIFIQVLERAAKSYIWDVGSSELGKRDLDVLLERSPAVLQKYITQVLEDISEASV